MDERPGRRGRGSSLRTVFFGTPEWAVPSLRALLASPFDVAAVVTNPDKRAGRGMKPQPSPVKEVAVETGIEVLQPQRASAVELYERLRKIGPDVAVVVAYGKLLPAALLAIPRLGFVNVHFSLLPSYRGAAPVQHALLDGVRETGVSIMVLTEGMDEGPVLATQPVAVPDDDTAGTLGARLAEIGAALLVATLPRYADGSLEPVEQDHRRASYAPKLSAEQARIDWNQPAATIRNLVRALNPEPGAWTTLQGRRLKVGRVAIAGSQAALAPGELRADASLLAGTAERAVDLLEVQPAGKRWMSGQEFARGLRLRDGERFE